MKFSNGCWLQKEHCECFDPKQAYFTKIEPGKVTICAPTVFINHRGDTLGSINLTVVLTSPAEDIIRVQTWHHLGARKKTPEFELNIAENSPMNLDITPYHTYYESFSEESKRRAS